MVVAPAGTGKTRLLQATVEALREDMPVERLIGTQSARGLPLAAVAALLPARAPTATEPLDLFRAVRDALLEKANGQRLLVVVDDAHLLDPLSAALLHHLAMTAGVVLVVALRSGEPVEDSLTALWRDGIADRIELEPLGLARVTDLLGKVLGGEVETATVRRLWSKTGGNPLYLHEVVIEALRVGTLVEVQGLWRWDGEVRVGSRLRELVELRLAVLSDEERSVIDLLAIGELVEERTVERACQPRAVASLLARGLVQRAATGDRAVLQLDHPMFAEVVRGAISTRDHARWCGVLADAIEVTTADDATLLRVAVWQLDAGMLPDRALLTRAAELAVRHFDGALGARLARAAIDAGGGAAAMLVAAEASLVGGDFAGALRHAEAIDERTLPDELVPRLATMLAEAGYWGLGRTVETTDALQRITNRVSSPVASQRVRALQSAVMVADFDLVAATDLGLAIARDPRADPLARLRAITAAATGLSRQGLPDDAIALCEGLLPIGLDHVGEMPRGIGWVIAQLLAAYFCVGRFDEVEQLLSPVRDAAIAEGDDEVVSSSSLVLARLALTRGDLDAAEARLCEGLAGLRTYDPAGYLPWCLGMMAQLAGQRGDAAPALEALRKLDGITWHVHLFDHEVAMGRAWAAAASGELTTPIALLEAAADDARAAGSVFTEGVLLHEALRLGARDRNLVERIASSCISGQLPYHSTFVAHGRALLADDGAALDEVASSLEGFGMMLMAAEAGVEAAASHRRAGQRGRATRAEANASRLRGRCPGARTPALSLSAEVPELTRREREVASLAGQQLSNQVIAERLAIGVRTVEGHLLRAMTKLGVSARQDLASVLEADRNA